MGFIPTLETFACIVLVHILRGLNGEFDAIGVLGQKNCVIGEEFLGIGVYFEMD